MSSLDRAWGRHRTLARAATVLVIGIGVLIPNLPAITWWIGFGLGLALTGVPHGGADHRVAQPLLQPRLGALWLPAFVASYVALAGLVAVVWTLTPPVALLVFLALSILHFGRGDAGGSAPLTVVAALGMTPLIGPLLAWPQTSATLFSALTDEPAALWSSRLDQAFWPLLVGFGVTLAASWPRLSSPTRLDVALLIVVGVVLPPIGSFALYFCVWHAPRHILREIEPRPDSDQRWRQQAVGFVRDAAPATGGALTLAVAAWLFWQPTWGVHDATVRTVFIGLAALTVPHMVVHDLATRTRNGSVSWRGVAGVPSRTRSAELHRQTWPGAVDRPSR